MYLINTKTLKLKQFVDERAQQYAILSHRWEEGEVTFAQINAKTKLSSLKGYYKLRKCCEQASRDKLRYAWIDTCCIDKSSSAELQEAINSMFRWYKSAVKCYVYLSDVEEARLLPCSQWFTRGWTLQELIAPDHVEFYDCRWQFIGDKRSFASMLSEVTRVPEALLYASIDDSLRDYSIAEKMSWASGRVTTRTEDRAYSLLGIFDVNMPMLYGEGEKAFIRLQEEILRKSSDQSILAWTGIRANSSNILASSPDQFSYHHPQELTRPYSSQHPVNTLPLQFSRRGAHSMTNEGLTLDLELMPWQPNVFLALLNHKGRVLPHGFPFSEDVRQQTNYGIFLLQVDAAMRFVRIRDNTYGDLYVYPRDRNDSDYIGKRWVEVRGKSRVLKVTIVQCLMADEMEKFTFDDAKPFPGFEFRPELDQNWSPVPWEGTEIDCNESISLRFVQTFTGKYGAIADFYPEYNSHITSVTIGIDFWFCPVICVKTRSGPLNDREDWDRAIRDRAIRLWDVPGYEFPARLKQYGGPSKQACSIDKRPLCSSGVDWAFVFGSGCDISGTHIISICLPSKVKHEAIYVSLQMERKNIVSPWSFTFNEKTCTNFQCKSPTFDWLWLPDFMIR